MRIVRLSDEIVAAVLANIPGALFDVLKTQRVVLAGGVVRDAVSGDKVKDVDVFCHSREDAARLALSLGVVRTTTFSSSVELGLPVQFVFYREYSSPAELIRQFDFRACGAAVYYTENGFVGVALEGFEEDVKARRLTFLHQPKDEGSLVPLKRVMHFVQKGWRISDDGLSGILSHFEPTLKPERVSLALRPHSYGGRR